MIRSAIRVAMLALLCQAPGAHAFVPGTPMSLPGMAIATDDGVKVGAAYKATDERIVSVSSFVSPTGEDAALRTATFEESVSWYAGITADMFG